MSNPFHVACLGGGHGLYQTLLAAQKTGATKVTAIVTVADDGGSSGRLRRELAIIPPGDLRMALAALSDGEDEGRFWATTLQHRFGGHGALAGHALGNLLIAGLTEILGDSQAALDKVAELTESHGRVLPVVNEPLEIEAEVAGLDEDPRVVRSVRGQVAVASTPGQVRRVRIIPEDAQVNELVLEAIGQADLITLGPGSWFSSVLPHVVIPRLMEAISAADALRVVVLNLSAEPGETQGFSAERHLHVLAQHAPGLRIDKILVEEKILTAPSEREYLQRAARVLGATVEYADLCRLDDNGQPTSVHDPDKLSAALSRMHSAFLEAGR